MVLGGGPAGCAAARLLSSWGHDVQLVTRAPGASPLAESLPPSCGKLFDVLGIRDAVDDAGFVRTTGNTVWWGERETRVERFAGGECGWQVTANALEPILRDAATSAGARMEIGRLTYEALPERPAFVLDCTGRSGVVARGRGWRVLEKGHRTVALVALWQRAEAWPVPDHTHTLLESYTDGWAWSVPATDRNRFVAVMVDPLASNLAKGASARDVYLSEIAKTRRFTKLLYGASLLDGPHGWDASMYSSSRFADDHVLLVGDAGSFIDPLSSIGVKKALASGWLAAVAVHTAIGRPSMREIALDFFSAREAEIYTAFLALTAQYLADAASAHLHPFWTDRVDTDRADLPTDARSVQVAFDRLRSACEIALQRAPDLRVEDRPAVAGCEIVMEARIVSDVHPAGIRYLSDVDLLALIDLAPDYQQVPDVFEAYNRRHAPVSLPDFLTALATAVASGFLLWGGPDS